MKKVASLGLGLLAWTLISNGQDFQGLPWLREIKVNQRKDLEFISFEENNFPCYSDFYDAVGDEAKNSFENGIMNVYFHHDDASLTQNDVYDIKRYVRNVLVPYVKENGGKIKNITLKSYANHLGSPEYNYSLAVKRAKNVESILKTSLHGSFPFEIDLRVMAFGDTKSVQDADSLQLMKDRRVEIVVEDNPLENILDRLKCDVFLLDQSGSMKDGSWEFLRDYKFPEAKGYFSFSKISFPEGSDKKNFPEFNFVYDINQDSYGGRTNFYEATDKLISSEILEVGDNLTAMVNGKDNVGGVSLENLIQNAKNKEVCINVVAMNVDANDAADLIRLPKETGGKYVLISPKVSSK